MEEIKKIQGNRAKHFSESRKKTLQIIAEDYTELISDLVEQNGVARPCDIARELGVSHVSALKALKRLTRLGYLSKKPNQPVELTKKGEELARFCKRRHEILLQFFHVLGIPKEIVETDVEGIEHHVSERSLEAIQAHLNRLDSQKDIS
ncbi:MAG: manganese-binding transcriptional regulator MntR [Simkaniaceae bacterium]